ncbi:hypothetical protein [Lentibacillus salicampi]|uniref:hypothetical protein n=1 Tax=Lentibacillus salicampi TaxID=175306 RepID=UPI0014304FC6|nr:hypothetical protein [Lentibacillus salicampi]
MKKRLLLLITLIAVNPLFVAVAHAEQENPKPSPTSEAAVMIDAETGDVIYEKKRGYRDVSRQFDKNRNGHLCDRNS